LRDFAAADFRAGFFFAALLRARFFAGRALALLTTLATVFLAMGMIGLPVAAAFPARAPTIPPTTAPAGPAMLPIAAPATAPAVSFGIGGISIFSFSCASGWSGIIREAPSLRELQFKMYFAAANLSSCYRLQFLPEIKKRPPWRTLFNEK
jgi:hypothetical protein